MTFAIVPGAGLSSRMGRPKLMIEIGGQSVIELVVAALQAGGVDRVLVAIGPHVPELGPRARAAGADVLALPEQTLDMRATVERGFDWVEQHLRPQPDDSWLLVPADYPILDPMMIRKILAADGGIVIPVCDGRNGHPTRFRWKHVASIRALPAGHGINRFVRDRAAEVCEVPASPDVLVDLDSPEDLVRLSARFHHLLTNVRP
jgi:molybdenum cofactor cytidylyltransferase